MSYTRSLLQLRKSLAKKVGVAGPSGDTASSSLTADVMNEQINDGLEEAWDVIVDRWEDYYTKSAQLTVTSGIATQALPGDFLKLRRLWVLDSSTEYKRLLPGDLDQAHLYTSTTLSGKNYRYRMDATGLVLMPVPPQNETLKLFYIPTAPQLVADGDVITFDVPLVARLVLAIAWRECLDAQDMDVSPAISKIVELTAKCRVSADGRDADQPFYLNPAMPLRDETGDDDDRWW